MGTGDAGDNALNSTDDIDASAILEVVRSPVALDGPVKGRNGLLHAVNCHSMTTLHSFPFQVRRLGLSETADPPAVCVRT